MGYGKIYFENQALEMDDLPPKTFYTPYPILGEMGTKKQPFSPLPLFGVCKSCVKFDPALLESPCLHTLVIYEGSDHANAILADPRMVKEKDYLEKLLYPKDARYLKNFGEIRTIYHKMNFIQHKIEQYITEYDFIESVELSEMGKIRITYKDDELAIVNTLLDQYVMESVVSCATPRGFALRPIGLGGKERFVNLSVLEGYKGLYTYLSPTENPLQGRYPLTWTLSAFLQILYMLPLPLNEHALIKAGMLMEQCLRIGVEATTIAETIQILPWWSRWTLRPSYCSLEKTDIARFLLKLYVLGRYLALMKTAGVTTFIHPVRWHWTGKTVASTEFLEGCFRGMYTTAISGLTSMWAWPASSAYMKMGEWQIMGQSIKKRNFWHQMGSVNEMNIRSQIVFVENKDVDFPNLLDEGYDSMIVSLEPNLSRARQEEIYHLESKPPRTILKAEWIGPMNEKDVMKTLFQSAMVGGQPLFTVDTLIESVHDIVHFEHANLIIPELISVKASRALSINESLVSEVLAGVRVQDEGLMYDGDELNIAGNGNKVSCPICGKLYDSRGLKNHITSHTESGVEPVIDE